VHFGVYFAYFESYFGTNHFGANYSIFVAAPAIGSFTFGYMAGALYEQQTNANDTKCYGDSCYSLAFMVSALLSYGAAIVALYLNTRRKRLNKV
jgi:hypothetical protein